MAAAKGGGPWTVQQYFDKRYDISKAPDVPNTAQIADMTSPFANRGVVVAGLKCLPLNTTAPGPAEVTRGAWVTAEGVHCTGTPPGVCVV